MNFPLSAKSAQQARRSCVAKRNDEDRLRHYTVFKDVSFSYVGLPTYPTYI